MQIFVRSLTDYTNQLLCGKYIDISFCENASDIIDLINDYLNYREKLTGEVHEEFAIHEYVNFPDLGEYPNFDEMNEILSISCEYQVSPFTVKGFIDHGCNPKTFGDCFVGVYESEENFAEEFIKNNFDVELLQTKDSRATIQNPIDYIDYERVARDIFINDFFSVECKAGVVVFLRQRS